MKILAFLLATLGAAAAVTAQAPTSPVLEALKDVSIEQRLGERVPAELEFRDETGRTVRLSDYLGRRPVVLALVYYECPMLCSMVLNGLTKAARAVSFDIGSDYDVVAVSIDPRETPELAAEKKQQYVRQYGREGGEAGWHFLTGEEAAIRRLADAVGFRYTYDAETGLYNHAAGVMLLTADGTLARYLYGIEYAPRDLRLGLVEASENRIGSPVDQLLLYCFHYDPATGRYSLLVMNVLRVAGVATVLLLGTFVLFSLRRERPRPAAAHDRGERA